MFKKKKKEVYLDEVTARKAASWWADHLRNGAKLDNGDMSETGAMTMALGMMAQTTFSATDAQNFEDALVDILVYGGEYGEIRYLGVDYHPCGELQEAATKANVSLGSSDLPWKTSMYFDGGKITFSEGYQAEMQTL